jgi:hypothetical protein
MEDGIEIADDREITNYILQDHGETKQNLSNFCKAIYDLFYI